MIVDFHAHVFQTKATFSQESILNDKSFKIDHFFVYANETFLYSILQTSLDIFFHLFISSVVKSSNSVCNFSTQTKN
jgi:hypothetical protein